MKTLVKVNKVLIIITALMFLTIWTIWLGFLSEIILGGFQLILSLTTSVYWNKMTDNQKKKLSLYWLFVIIWFAGWFLDFGNLSNEMFFFFLGTIIIPMSLAVYLTLILEDITKNI